jgi:hypothetical protein
MADGQNIVCPHSSVGGMAPADFIKLHCQGHMDTEAQLSAAWKRRARTAGAFGGFWRKMRQLYAGDMPLAGIALELLRVASLIACP